MMMKPRRTRVPLYRLSWGEARNRIQNAVLLAGMVMFVAFPMFYYQYSRLGARFLGAVPGIAAARGFAVGQSLLLFGAALVCSLVGFLYYDRLRLPGFGKGEDLKRWLPLGLFAGLLWTPLCYFLGDRFLLSLVPELFPRPWPWAMAWAAGAAASQEVVARFGLMTILVYILRWTGFEGHPWPATGVVSLFALVSSLLFVERGGLAWSELFPAALPLFGLLFLAQLALCEVFLRRGLVACLALHLGLGIRLVIYSLLP